MIMSGTEEHSICVAACLYCCDSLHNPEGLSNCSCGIAHDTFTKDTQVSIANAGLDKTCLVLRVQAVYMAKLGLKNNRVSLWTVAGIITAAALIAVVAGYAVHKLRMRHVMQNEIRDIMCAPYHALSTSLF